MGKYVGIYDCQVHMGCQEEICIIANSLEEAEKYIEDGYSSYMASWEYTAMDTWRTRIEEEQGEEPEDCEDFYESQECEDFWSDGYWTVREVYDHPIVIKDFIVLSHAPQPFICDSRTPYVNFFGHVHDSKMFETYGPRHFCACVERHDYKPVNIEDIIKHFRGENDV